MKYIVTCPKCRTDIGAKMPDGSVDKAMCGNCGLVFDTSQVSGRILKELPEREEEEIDLLAMD